MIIDGDGHIVEPLSIWKDYVPRTMHERIRVDYGADGLGDRVVIDDLQFVLRDPARRYYPGDTITPGGLRDGHALKRPWERGERGGFYSDARLAMHDAEGIDAAVLYPTVSLCMINEIRNEDVCRAVVEGVNRWAADYASSAPDELYPVALLPRQYPELAAAELRRCVAEHGFVAGCIRPTPLLDGRLVSDASLDVLWKTAEELDVPITVHNVIAPHTPQVGRDRAKSFVLLHAAAHPFEAMLAFGCMLEARIFERFERLRIGFMESGSGWAPFWTERLEEHVEILGWTFDPPLSLCPVELFQERCAIGTESEEKMVAYVQQVLGEEAVIWSSDYPHFDTHSPFVLPREDLSERQRDGLYRRAALRFYRLDEARIARSNARRRNAAGGTKTGTDQR